METAPLILVTASTQRSGAEFYDYSISLSDPYTQAIVKAGGLPCIPPCMPEPRLIAEYVRRCDGVMISGGDDIQPELYNPKVAKKLKATCGEHDPLRDLFETILIQEVFQQRKPLLLICRGMQMLNICLGGTLITDLPSQRGGPLNHGRLDLKDKIVHPINLAQGALLTAVLGRARVGVNSSHHQAIDILADCLEVTASAEDGVIEAVEFKASERHRLPFMIAVQYHPERLLETEPVHFELFRSFTAAAALDRASKNQQPQLVHD